MIRKRIKDLLKEYKEELDLFVDDLVLQKMQEQDIPSKEEFLSLKKRIQDLEEEKELLLKRSSAEHERGEAPSVPNIRFEHASCRLCERPEYRSGYCLYHFELQFSGK